MADWGKTWADIASRAQEARKAGIPVHLSQDEAKTLGVDEFAFGVPTVIDGRPDYVAALVRARDTECRCRAAVWMKNRRSGEWYEWDTCTDDPGHDGPHAIRDYEGWQSFHDWQDGDSGIDESNYGAVIRTEWRAEPSPWTEPELVAWRSISDVSEDPPKPRRPADHAAVQPPPSDSVCFGCRRAIVLSDSYVTTTQPFSDRVAVYHAWCAPPDPAKSEVQDA